MSYPCPKCKAPSSRVIDTRYILEPYLVGATLRRRRGCNNQKCKHRWTTAEINLVRAKPGQHGPKLQTSTEKDLKARLAKRLRADLSDLIKQLATGEF